MGRRPSHSPRSDGRCTASVGALHRTVRPDGHGRAAGRSRFVGGIERARGRTSASPVAPRPRDARSAHRRRTSHQGQPWTGWSVAVGASPVRTVAATDGTASRRRGRSSMLWGISAQERSGMGTMATAVIALAAPAGWPDRSADHRHRAGRDAWDGEDLRHRRGRLDGDAFVDPAVGPMQLGVRGLGDCLGIRPRHGGGRRPAREPDSHRDGACRPAAGHLRVGARGHRGGADRRPRALACSGVNLRYLRWLLISHSSASERPASPQSQAGGTDTVITGSASPTFPHSTPETACNKRVAARGSCGTKWPTFGRTIRSAFAFVRVASSNCS